MNDGPIEIVDAEPEVFSLPLEELRRLLVVATNDQRTAEHTLATVKASSEYLAQNSSSYADCKNEGERARFISVWLADDTKYQKVIENEAEARLERDIYRTEIQIREDARLDRQMAQRDRELDILAGNLALAERNQARLEQQGEAMAEQMASLRATVESVHADHADDYPPISKRHGRA
jgi:chromosome segregation ATPase